MKKKTNKQTTVKYTKDNEFDELIIDDWIHLERMDKDKFWMRLGQVEFDITILPNGQPEIKVRKAEIRSMGDGVELLVERS